jgi:hypothetical protein
MGLPFLMLGIANTLLQEKYQNLLIFASSHWKMLLKAIRQPLTTGNA